MEHCSSRTIRKTCQYIEQNAMLFDFTCLFKMLEKMGYSLDDVSFSVEPSLHSQESYINSIRFNPNNKVKVTINDINLAYFIDAMKEYFEYVPKIMHFFNGLAGDILYTANMAMFLEGKKEILSSYRNGNALVSLNDGNLRSFAYIHNSLKCFFSDYTTVIFESVREVTEHFNPCRLGESKLSKNSKLGDRLSVIKTFIVIRFISETKLSDKELEEINKKLDNFKYRFRSILSEINILAENCVTDEELYTKIPFEFTRKTKLVQRFEVIRCEYQH